MGKGMRVVVFGASGAVGRFLQPLLREAGATLTMLSRRQDAGNDGAEWVQGTLPDRVPQLPPCDAVICLGPLDHFASWLQRAALDDGTRIVALSSMSAESKRDAPLAAERELSARLRASETRLADICRQRALPWTVLRATLIYGGGDDRSLTPLARMAVRWRIFPLPAGRGLRQPIHARDLAAAVHAAWQSREGAGLLEAGGGERLPARAMFARVRASLACRTLPLPLPRTVLKLAAAVRPGLRGMLARLDQDLVADNRALESRLGVRPGPFRP